MVKVCPECGEKNFDDAKYCMKCNTNIKRIEKLPDKPFIFKDDEYSYYTPRGYCLDPGVREYFTIPAIVLAIVSFFFLPIFLDLFAFIFASRSIIKGDSYGYIAIFIAVLSLIVRVILPLIGIAILPNSII